MATDDLPALPPGFRASGVKAGIKPSGGLDMAVLIADGPCSAAGTFTTNRVAAAPVKWCRSLVPSDSIRAVVINAGNANAATGALGLENVEKTAKIAAERLGCRADQILVASTGVIGHQLPMDRLADGLNRALDAATYEKTGLDDASRSILTTDTRPKIAWRAIESGGKSYQLVGIAKGAAMIGPKMATMLAFLMTDAPISPDALQKMLSKAVDESFNCVSVEGHMSTNDSAIALSYSDPGSPSIDDESAFPAIRDVCIELARAMADDGEGATHLITIDVEGCRTRDEARSIARAVADSPLVKTAIHGADPNWGRIVSAAGYAGVPFEESELSLWLDGIPLYASGAPLDFDAAAVSARIKSRREVPIRLVLNSGTASVRFWTCDLTAEYIRLNAEYTT